MELKRCILSLSLLAIVIVALLSCDDTEPEYHSKPDLDVKFVPFTSVGRFIATEHKYLATCTSDMLEHSYVVKVGVDGSIDSTMYSFFNEDRGYRSLGTLSVNGNNQIFIYGHDYDNVYSAMRFDNDDFTHFVHMSFELPSDQMIMAITPLDNGGFAVIARYFENFGSNDLVLYRIDADGNEREPMRLKMDDVSYVSALYSVNNNLIISYSNLTGGVVYDFFTLDGQFINEFVDSGENSSHISIFNRNLYLCYSIYDYGACHVSITSLDGDGNLLQTSPLFRLDDINNLTEVNGRVYVAGHRKVKYEKQSSKEYYEGMLFSMDIDNFQDVDSVKMSYNAVPLAVYDDAQGGYFVFLSRMFNYTDDMSRDVMSHNVYIYHTDDLHNLQN